MLIARVNITYTIQQDLWNIQTLNMFINPVEIDTHHQSQQRLQYLAEFVVHQNIEYICKSCCASFSLPKLTRIILQGKICELPKCCILL